jgi:hypothetical protein
MKLNVGITGFQDVVPCDLVDGHQYFEEMCCLKARVIIMSNYQTAQHHISNDRNLHGHYCGNLKSLIKCNVCQLVFQLLHPNEIPDILMCTTKCNEQN